MKFGDRLKVLIEEREITQKELAAQMNIAPSTVSSYVQNTREPDFKTLIEIARYFGVSRDYLLGYKPADSNTTSSEDELLRIFRQLSPEQKDICIEQCKVFIKVNQRRMKKSS